jgi:dUTP pyrophosphatase
MNFVSVGFTKLHPEAVVPEPAHGYQEDAGADLRSVEPWIIPSGSRAIVSTGISIQLKPGLEAQIRSRSGLSAKHGIFVLNSPGTIDPSYRGELKVIVQNFGDQTFEIHPGDRIAQLVVAPYFGVNWAEAKPEASIRGAAGLGSTGVK